MFLLSACCCSQVVVESYSKDGLPDPLVPGHLARVTDRQRGLWVTNGSNWFSLSGELVNVKEFGAKGDGSTDDTAPIQAALNAGHVFLPPGSYIVRPLSIPSRRMLIGTGSSSILKLKAGTKDYYNTLSIVGAPEVVIRDLADDGNGNKVTGPV